jgi:hypothetical protein
MWDEVEADIECEADAENPYQEGCAVGFNEARFRIENAIGNLLTPKADHD